jgi:prophage tail gpP-like protein
LVKKHRPFIKKQNVETGSIVDPAKAVMAEQLKNIAVVISCRGWKVIDDNIISPGDMITLIAPEVYLYRKTKLLISKIVLKEDANGKYSELNCILPEAITGETPVNIFN